jgi:type II secretory pathway pseudopilin PulG
MEVVGIGLGSTMMTTSESRCQAGMNLIETMIATFILLVGLGALMSLFTVAASQTANQGEFATRTTEYALDKMEQLLSLSFSDSTTNTAVYPPTSTGGTGLGASLTAGGSVGGVTLTSPVTGYVDYLDYSGNLLTSSSGWFYKRQWKIDLNAASNLKTITVIATAKLSEGGGTAVSTTLVCFKSNIP